MIVFGLNMADFEYAFRLDGPFLPEKGFIFDKTKPLLDPYARAVTGQSVWGAKSSCDVSTGQESLKITLTGAASASL